MATISQKRAYTEVLEVLEKLNFIDKIPNELIETMRREKDSKVIFIFDKSKPLREQMLSKKGAELLSLLYLTYICENQEEKEKLKKIYKENENKKIK